MAQVRLLPEGSPEYKAAFRAAISRLAGAKT
jgi:hypothetical protein